MDWRPMEMSEADRSAGGLGVFELTDKLRRAAYLENQLIRQSCGWFLRIKKYELRHRIGYHIWTHAEHVKWINERLGFLRGGKSSVSLEPALIRFVEMVINAPNEYAFLRGTYLVLKKSLLRFYQETARDCDPAANAYDLRMINRIIPEIEEQMLWVDQILAEDPNPDVSIQWESSLSVALNSIGGIEATAARNDFVEEPAGYQRFSPPDHLLFDERISDKPLMPHDEKTSLPYEDALVEQFRIFFNEIYAAGILASILYDAFDHDMSAEFIHDFTRHFWDECRHSEFGAVRLKELGQEPDRVNQKLFRNSQSMPLLHKVCYLTLVLEPHYMPRKKPRFREYETAGDARSQLFADHDWSDEINHVRLGKDWLDKLLSDDARSIEQLKDETRAILARLNPDENLTLSPF
ncbi:MAG: DUF455 family protein [Rhodothermales bacterium]|nr:DUF455 family protein [Rhodothermales bacterium]